VSKTGAVKPKKRVKSGSRKRARLGKTKIIQAGTEKTRKRIIGDTSKSKNAKKIRKKS